MKSKKEAPPLTLDSAKALILQEQENREAKARELWDVEFPKFLAFFREQSKCNVALKPFINDNNQGQIAVVITAI